MTENRQKEQNRRIANDGFSLVEVLVCVAILAIISVPILQSLNTSARLNQKAHYTQKLTNYAQEELEVVKALSLTKPDETTPSEYERYLSGRGEPYQSYARLSLSDGNVIMDASVSESEDGGVQANAAKRHRAEALAQSIFSDSAGVPAAKIKELTEPFFYRINGLEIGSDHYAMQVTVEPAVYSMLNAETADPADSKSYGTDINVSGFVNLKNADASFYPVLSDAVNLYDGGDAGAALLQNIREKYQALGIGVDDADIGANILKTLTKTVEIKVEVVSTTEADGSTSAETQVTAAVNYRCTYATPAVELHYIAYSGSYPYKAGSAGDAVYVFADAYEGKNIDVTDAAGNHCINNIQFDVSAPTDMPVDVYFIRSTPKSGEIGYNFDEIKFNSLSYLGSSEMKKGEYHDSGAGADFYTNVKCARFNLNTRLEDEIKAEATIGSGEYAVRCYQITVELFEQDEDGNTDASERAAYVTSTKLVRE